MAFVIADRVRETTLTSGTGTLTLAGPYSGFQAFSVIGNGNTTYYAVIDPTTGAWEVGIGTYTSSGNTLSRDTVLSSSNSGGLVSFGSGVKDAICTQPSERNVYVVGSDVVAENSAKVPNTLLANSSVTINGNTVDLGGSTTVTANLANALTLGSYLSGTSFNGSAAVTTNVNAATTNTAGAIVARDGSGNFAAGTITATRFSGPVTGPVGNVTPSTGEFTEVAATGLYVNTINDASGGNSAVLYGVAAPANSMGFRNRIINGDMRIDQRNAGASVTPNTEGQYAGADRWSYNLSASGTFSVQQNAGAVTPPAGFTNYLGVTSLSAYSVVDNDVFGIVQKVEGFNTADLAWGTASAQAVTLSFWVRSSLTGNFGGAISNANYTRSYPFLYTINAANTWEYKTINIPGDTTSIWLTTNGTGLVVQLSLGAVAGRSAAAGAWIFGWAIQATGSTSVVGTNGATFYITGVQLEAGSVATPFERRDYGRELIMCQRYYQKLEVLIVSGYNIATDFVYAYYTFPVQLRIMPNLVVTQKFGNNTGNVLAEGVDNKSFGVSARITTTGAGFRYFGIETSGVEL